jgi:hypothetical protein
MESNRNFEQFIKEGADQYRMYPSEKVWRGVHNALHTRRRRWIIGFTVLLFVGGITSLTFINTNHTEENTIAADNMVAENKNISPDLITKENNTAVEVEKNIITSSAPKQTNTAVNILFAKPAKKIRISKAENSIVTEIEKLPVTAKEVISEKREAETLPVAELNSPVPQENIQPSAIPPVTEPVAAPANEITGTKEKEEVIKTNDSSPVSITDNNKLKENNNAVENFAAESIVNAASKKVKKSKFSVQGFFTPTVSYRKLTENKEFLRRTAVQNNNLVNNYAYFLDVNNAVRHKANMGVEAGANVRYDLSKSISLRAGLQFNVSRYNIRAYSYAGDLATIALNTGYYGDSLRTFSTYSNEKGYRQDWLQNLYFQLSAPVGVELRLGGNDKFNYGIAGSLQPTYILGDRSYLLSSDFKNYAEVSWLTRRWNLNTAIEAFVAYNTGKLKWQIGPQIRRQMFSSFVKEYPVKEYPFDVGIKVGIQLNK